MQDKLINYDNGFTHGGVMHADEVFASAFLRLINPDFKISRQLNRNDTIIKDSKTLVFDVGLGKYDHHQEDGECRDNGNKYASFGLIVKYFGKEIGLSETQIKFLDTNMIESMDLSDNKGKLNDYSTIIDRFNKGWNSENILENELFEEAVNFAKKILEKELDCLIKNKYNAQNILKIEQIYIEAFLKLIGVSYNPKECSTKTLIDTYNKYGKEFLNEQEFIIMLDKIKRYQTIFDKKNYKAGFVKIVNNYTLSIPNERNEAIDLIENLLEKDLNRSKSDVLGMKIVEELYKESNKNYLILPKAGLPWTRVVTSLNASDKSKDIDYIIFPSSGGDYGIQAVSKKYSNKSDLRKPFPEDWRGKPVEELNDIVEGFTFCHLSGFYCASKTIDSAINIVNKLT